MDAFAIVLLGALAALLLWVWILGRYYPGSGLEQLGLRSARQITEDREELEAEDLIERRRSPEDRRRHVVVLTEAGAKRLAEAECALAAVDNEVLGALNDSQREVLYNLLLQAASGSDVSCPLD